MASTTVVFVSWVVALLSQKLPAPAHRLVTLFLWVVTPSIVIDEPLWDTLEEFISPVRAADEGYLCWQQIPSIFVSNLPEHLPLPMLIYRVASGHFPPVVHRLIQHVVLPRPQDDLLGSILGIRCIPLYEELRQELVDLSNSLCCSGVRHASPNL